MRTQLQLVTLRRAAFKSDAVFVVTGIVDYYGVSFESLPLHGDQSRVSVCIASELRGDIVLCHFRLRDLYAHAFIIVDLHFRFCDKLDIENDAFTVLKDLIPQIDLRVIYRLITDLFESRRIIIVKRFCERVLIENVLAVYGFDKLY